MLLVDEFSGDRRELGEARFVKPVMTVRELLHARADLELEVARDVLAERLRVSREAVANHAGNFAGSHEWRLNGAEKTFRPRMFELCADNRLPDRDTVLRNAEAAFHANQFFVLLDDREAESLDEVIEIERTGEATFVLLTPLQGG